MAMDFSGNWKVHEQENPEDFLKAISAPAIYFKMINEVKPVTTIHQNGDEFTISVKSPMRSNTNSFTIGMETDFNTIDGKKIRGTARLADGKIVIEAENFTHVREIQGLEMIETITYGTASLVRRSRRI